jgi:cytochrome c-type biogenesis protein CcmE
LAERPDSKADNQEQKRGFMANNLFPVMVTAMAVGGLFLVVMVSTGGGEFDKNIDTLKNSDKGKRVRVSGTILKGSYKKLSEKPLRHQFEIGNSDGKRVTVNFDRLLPDGYKAGREAIIHGKLKSPTEIDATKIVVKCPSKYKEETSTAKRDWKDYNKGGAGDQSVAPRKNVSPRAPEAVP